MKFLIVIFSVYTLMHFSCVDQAKKIIEAKEAQRKSDSIMAAFKKIDNDLQRTNDSIVERNDDVK